MINSKLLEMDLYVKSLEFMANWILDKDNVNDPGQNIKELLNVRLLFFSSSS